MFVALSDGLLIEPWIPFLFLLLSLYPLAPQATRAIAVWSDAADVLMCKKRPGDCWAVTGLSALLFGLSKLYESSLGAVLGSLGSVLGASWSLGRFLGPRGHPWAVSARCSVLSLSLALRLFGPLGPSPPMHRSRFNFLNAPRHGMARQHGLVAQPIIADKTLSTPIAQLDMYNLNRAW